MIDINELRRLAEYHDGVTSSAPIKPATILELLDRRAIVRTAAEIGRNMK